MNLQDIQGKRITFIHSHHSDPADQTNGGAPIVPSVSTPNLSFTGTHVPSTGLKEKRKLTRPVRPWYSTLTSQFLYILGHGLHFAIQHEKTALYFITGLEPTKKPMVMTHFYHC